MLLKKAGGYAMKSRKDGHIRLCPICGQSYHDAPALSRVDGKTQICPDCGTREALCSIGVDAEEQQQILNAIHRYTQR